jgi:hypothetical protein
MTPDKARRILFAASKELGLDDDARRELVRHVTGETSTRNLSSAQWSALVSHLNKITGRPENEWSWVDQAVDGRKPMLRKIIVLCRELGIERGHQMAYVEGVARQMAGHGGLGKAIDTPLRMCGQSDLWRIIAALEIHLRRQQR